MLQEHVEGGIPLGFIEHHAILIKNENWKGRGGGGTLVGRQGVFSLQHGRAASPVRSVEGEGNKKGQPVPCNQIEGHTPQLMIKGKTGCMCEIRGGRANTSDMILY